MSLILCPECGAKISDRAISCPHCGYISKDYTRPIGEQDFYEPIPKFQYDLEQWHPSQNQLGLIGFEDNKRLVQYFGNWKTIQLGLPAIAQVIKTMADKEKILVAKMDPYIKRLIDEGIYRFSIDKNGEILPTIRDAKEIVKQVRLEEIVLTPELTNLLNNLVTHAAMAQILDEIEYIGDAIRGIHIELQNDRIALAEGAKDKILLASKIQDTKLREYAILDAIGTATEAKRILMRNFSENLRFVQENSHKTDMQLFKEGKKGRDIPNRVSDAFQALVSITNMVQIECEGYSLLGEYESSKESLLQFKQFITENKLDCRDTLLILNENTPQQKLPVVDEFMHISERITTFNANSLLDKHENLILVRESNHETEHQDC